MLHSSLDRLNLPSLLVLNGCGITSAGDESEIAAFCAHVSELDLSHNQFEDWFEVGKIVSNLPQLEFLNLSSNPLGLSALQSSCASQFSNIRKLVLNNVKASWETVHTLIKALPELEELFLCLNEFKTVSYCSSSCHSLRLLHITDNKLHDWSEVRKLGIMFPNLEVLFLSNNNLTSIGDSEDTLARLFPNLRCINLHNSGLNDWEDIEKLNLFPRLEEVKVLGIPLLQEYSTEERRQLIIARLPSVSVLNASLVSAGEREDAERFFIRYYIDRPKEELGKRYYELVTKYGNLEPLAVVDLRPQSSAKIEVHFEGRVEVMTVRLDQTVAEFRKQLKDVVQLSTSNMRIYYYDQEMVKAFGPEEIKFSSRALHSYGIRDGDAIHVVPKAK
ncbi:tubulin-specific chaperone cofactor E-like protein isoform X2 [Protopterus annectens]|uniref:tubulin-specific chaperone cofactor E-like protein isoform X2 n=1 Tax=Protopterus annectens TaxID=7888 RepID=UPI001CFA6179|nr:tubulin-specific chaperone cofactor E-like protein isoform X2 [Protopterus annectens]